MTGCWTTPSAQPPAPEHFANAEDGIECVLDYDGNRSRYRVVFRDTDADQVISVDWFYTYGGAVEHSRRCVAQS